MGWDEQSKETEGEGETEAKVTTDLVGEGDEVAERVLGLLGAEAEVGGALAVPLVDLVHVELLHLGRPRVLGRRGLGREQRRPDDGGGGATATPRLLPGPGGAADGDPGRLLTTRLGEPRPCGGGRARDDPDGGRGPQRGGGGHGDQRQANRLSMGNRIGGGGRHLGKWSVVCLFIKARPVSDRGG